MNDKFDEIVKALAALGDPAPPVIDWVMRQREKPDFSYAPGYRGSLPFKWREEDWISFDWASDEIVRRLGVSKGQAQATLRELCGGGIIRAIRYPMGFVEDKFRILAEITEPLDILPREWLKDQIDLVDDKRFPDDMWISIDVSKTDFEYWLAKEAVKVEPEADNERDGAIKRRLKEGKPGKDIQWKVFCEGVRKDCGKTSTVRGFSNETIENAARRLFRST
jgi:hypothetical protein